MNRTFVSGVLGVLFGFGTLVACGGGGGVTATQLIQGTGILASAHVQANSSAPYISRQMNPFGPPITVTRLKEGHFILDFGFDVSDGFYTVSPGNTIPSGSVHFAINAYVLPIKWEPSQVAVVLYNTLSKEFTDSGAFFVSVH